MLCTPDKEQFTCIWIPISMEAEPSRQTLESTLSDPWGTLELRPPAPLCQREERQSQHITEDMHKSRHLPWPCSQCGSGEGRHSQEATTEPQTSGRQYFLAPGSCPSRELSPQLPQHQQCRGSCRPSLACSSLPLFQGASPVLHSRSIFTRLPGAEDSGGATLGLLSRGCEKQPGYLRACC